MGKSVLIGHADDLATAELLKKKIIERFPDADIHIAYIGPIIGAHTGPGAVALFYWGSNR